MQDQPTGARTSRTLDDGLTIGDRTDDRLLGTPDSGTVATRTYGTPMRRTHLDTNEADEVKNRVQWGPIAAGVLTSLATLLLLTVLGLAVGSSAFEPGTDASDWGTGAGIWGGISAIIALFVGGWVAAKTAAVGGNFGGLMNGLMAGIATILLLIWLTTTGLSNVLGFLGSNIADITSVASETLGVDVDDATTGTDVNNTVNNAQASVTDAANSEDTYDRVRDGAWGTLAALVLALGAAALGGLLGSNRRADLVEGTGRA